MKNIAEILKDCPKGTELYSPIFGNVYLDKVRPHLAVVVTTDRYKEEFLYDGRYGINGECCIFPSKENRDWNKFEMPIIEGDVVVAEDSENLQMFIVKKYISNNKAECYIGYDFNNDSVFNEANWGFDRIASKDEKQKLFDVIKVNGYKWNSETKTLEKLIIPKFKVGDRIVHKENKNSPFTITEITEDCYNGGTRYSILIEQQDNFELSPNKFDISTLKPFDEVLVRNDNSCVWKCNLYSHYSQYPYHYICVGTGYKQCIPYESNEHLLGTNNDCDEFYKTW